MKRLSTLLATAVLALCFGVGQAAAEESPGGADQAAGQSADERAARRRRQRRLPERGDEPRVRHTRSQPRLER